MNNKLKKICGFMNYNTYINIQNSFLISSLGLFLSDTILLSKNLPLAVCLARASQCLASGYFVMYCSKGKNYTKDILAIKEEYSEFLNNYNNLNKTFNFNNPLEIFTMFDYLLWEGYLSKDKKFKYGTDEVKDIKTIVGTNVIKGNATCRHISAMLVDILDSNGIESGQLSVLSTRSKIICKFLDEPKYTKEELLNWIKFHTLDEEEYQQVLKKIEKLIDNNNVELTREVIENNGIIEKIWGNHAITFAYKDGICYFFDATQRRIYTVNDTKKNTLYNEFNEDVPFMVKSSKVLNDLQKYRKMKKILTSEYSSIDREEINKIVNKTNKICNNNQEIFEKFYNDNKDLYNDMSAKVLKLKNTIYR